MEFSKMLGSAECPYEFNLGLKKKEQFPGRPPYPQLLVLENETAHVREIRWQRIKVRASAPEIEKTEEIQIMRLVAVLEGGQEMEMQRIALPADVVADDPPDPSKCGSCGGKIPFGGGVEQGGKYYHFNCLI